jgi:hypothetical protein
MEKKAFPEKNEQVTRNYVILNEKLGVMAL